MKQHLKAPLDRPTRSPRTEGIAVIGMGCRLPGGVNSPASLWRLLADARDAVGPPPPGRRRLYPGDAPVPAEDGEPTWDQGGYLRDVAGFDAAFFGVSGREADVLDPQHRLLLEVTWEALEHAGLPPDRLGGTPTGVFTGISYADYMDRLAGGPWELEGSILTNGHCVAAGRVSYLLGLHGPCTALDTACSSSLVAVHNACQALYAGECELALAGGVTLTLQPRITRSFARMGMLSPTGRCRTFDAAADGFVRGEGCGIVVLKRLGDALRDGDRVLAVVRGSAVNQDGSSDSLAAPSAAAQRAVYRQALARAGIAPHTVAMVETHGTGTPVGDPVEFTSLADVYGTGPGSCALTSVKTNLGHLEPAAGVTGLIKAVLCLREGLIPPNLHFTRWNPDIDAARTRLFVPTETIPWPLRTPSRLAAVSSFGFSGTNAHVLLEQAPGQPRRRVPRARRSPRPGPDVFLLPAGSRTVLPTAATRLADWIEQEGAQVPLRDIAHTLALRRGAGRGRLAAVAATRGELVDCLRSFAAGTPPPTVVTGTVGPAVSRRPVWVFSGQGSQWPGMGRELLAREPAFREALKRADVAIRAHGGFSVLDVVRRGAPVSGCGAVQPVLFAMQIALAATWQDHGVEPAAVIGHSMGEVAAAVVAGALSLDDGALVICRRSALLSRLSGRGSMISVGLDAATARAEIAERGARTATVAVYSAPDSTVVAGDTEEMRQLADAWEERGIAVFPIAVDVASHCPQVDPVLAPLHTALAQLAPRTPQLPFYSTVTENGDPPRFDADYWCANLRRPVRFAQAVAAAAADRHQLYVEIAPHPVVSHSVTRSLAGLTGEPIVLPTLRRGDEEQTTFRVQLATLHCSGVDVDWRRLYEEGDLVDLPGITFERHHHWAPQGAESGDTTATTPSPSTAAAPLPGVRTEVPGTPAAHSWRGDVGTAAIPWFADHRVHGAEVLPGAVHCALALTAARHVFSAAPHEVQVTGLNFTHLLRLDAHTELATVVTATAPGRARCEILARDEMGEWTAQADAELHHVTLPAPARGVSVSAAALSHPVPLDAADLYRSLRRHGLEHGPSFTGLTTVRAARKGDDYWAEVTVPPEAATPELPLLVHPVLLDLCAQLAVAPLMSRQDQGRVLPVGMRSVRLSGDPATAAYCHARVTETSADAIVAQVRLLDASGAVLLAVDDLRFARHTEGDTEAADDWLLEIDWQPAPREAPEGAVAPGEWLVVGEADGSARALADALAAAGAGGSTWDASLQDTSLGAFRDALTDHLGRLPAPPRGIVLLCGAPLGDSTAAAAPGDDPGLAPDDTTGAGPAGPADDTDTPHPDPTVPSLRRTRRLLGTLQAIAAATEGTPPRLYVVTRGARSVRPDDRTDLGQSALRGVVRVAALEHPEIRPVLVDAGPAAVDLDEVARELLADPADDEIALRDDGRHVARLRPAPPRRAPGAATAHTVRYGVDGFELHAHTPGDLGSLHLAAAERRPPGPGEVELRVTAAGLNFRDVLTVMGLLPAGPDGRLPIGFECAGVVTALGPDVRSARIGDEVIAMDLRGGSFGSFTTVRADTVAPTPFGVDPTAAAGVPTAFVTAWYALRHLGRLAEGERVLIHSATGGTGLAAIAVARLLGAEVLATAGSEDKRRYLRAMDGVTHVMDSRTLDFGEQTREATAGQGVDVVLNSLSGAAIRTGLETLRPFGRFVELGVRDILSDAPLGMLALRHNITLSTVDLIEFQRDRPEAFAALLRDVLAEFEEGRLKPLPHTTYPLTEATRAFRTMAAADHIGKLVLTVPDRGETTAVAAATSATVRPGGAYIVTGGLRGLGLATARRLAAKGAGHLVLNGRTPATADTARLLAALYRSGTKITVVLGDIAEPGTAERLVATATADGLRLRGVVHCAMVLEDAVITNITDTQLDEVWAPKADGAWHLHRATEGHPLDWFALYSSMASLLGNPGQGAYAAVNSWLDGFAAWRSARGLPTLAVNWGPWGEIGVATDFARRGYQTLTTGQGLSALDTLLSHRRVQTGVIPGPPETWIPPGGLRLPFFSQVTPDTPDAAQDTGEAPAAGDPDGSDTAARLASLPAGPARRAALEDHLADHIRDVLRLRQGPLDPETPLKSLGFDSLLSMELRVRIETSLGIRLPADFVKRHPTLAALADGVAGVLEPDPTAE